MKICILSDEHYPHNGADTIVVINTASALGAAGADVTLATPRLWRKHKSAEAVCEHYGVRPTFSLVRLPSWPPPERRLRLEKLTHGFLGPLYAAIGKFDIIHSRDLIPLVLAHGSGRPWSFETYRRHAEEKPWLPPILRRLGLSRAVGAVAHSQASADDLVTLGFDPDAVLVARPGFAPEQFEPQLDRIAARTQLGLAVDGPLVVYVGNVGPSKGTDEIVGLAARLPGVRFLVVGGAEDAVRALRAQVETRGLENVIVAGYRPPSALASYLFAADILFVPAIFYNDFAGTLAGRLPLRRLPGTPLKIYGYMATGRPIVSADQPHTRDLLRHDHTALMVPPRDEKACAAAISRLIADPSLASRLAATAQTEAREHTWESRGKRILALFERRLGA